MCIFLIFLLKKPVSKAHICLKYAYKYVHILCIFALKYAKFNINMHKICFSIYAEQLHSFMCCLTPYWKLGLTKTSWAKCLTRNITLPTD